MSGTGAVLKTSWQLQTGAVHVDSPLLGEHSTCVGVLPCTFGLPAVQVEYIDDREVGDYVEYE